MSKQAGAKAAFCQNLEIFTLGGRIGNKGKLAKVYPVQNKSMIQSS
jgi:hypothetical protein